MDTVRLQHLVDLLRYDAANPVGAKFDLGSWAGFDLDGFNTHSYALKRELADSGGFTVDPSRVAGKSPAEVLDPAFSAPTMSCNTFVCALGLAALDPEFNNQGLNFAVVPLTHSLTAWMIPRFEGADGMDAGALFFDISGEDSRYFFDPDSYSEMPKRADGELLVAQRIEDFINGIVDHDYHPAYRDEEADDDNDDND